MKGPIGRLAPSPTGAQHVGNARTYLLAWLSARVRGGQVVLRIEDIDSPRIKPWAADQALDDLRWLGLDWDGEVLIQSARVPHYEQALSRLRQQECVYPCTCTRSEIERAASAPHLEHEGPTYPGTCAWRSARHAGALDAARAEYCWRFRVPERSPGFDDGFLGRCDLNLRQAGGDFVVWKKGLPAYQLAVVVDDAASGITEVVRGDDLVVSTPRQLLLYQALGWSPPRFTHVPLVVGPDGRRLAKRHGDTRLMSLRQAGVSAARLRGLLALSCGWIEELREVPIEELRERFSLRSIPRAPFVLTPDLLSRIGYQAG